MKKTSMGVLAAACVSMTAARHRPGAIGHQPLPDHVRTACDGRPGCPGWRTAGGPGPECPRALHVKSGDTLWDLSRMYLTSPWRWPELWGMNKQQIANPHLIYPGQQLRLVKENGRARLEIAGGGGRRPTRWQAAAVDPRPRCGSGRHPQHSDQSDSAVPVAAARARPDRAERRTPHRRHPGRPRLRRSWRQRLCARHQERRRPELQRVPTAAAALRHRRHQPEVAHRLRGVLPWYCQVLRDPAKLRGSKSRRASRKLASATACFPSSRTR